MEVQECGSYICKRYHQGFWSLLISETFVGKKTQAISPSASDHRPWPKWQVLLTDPVGFLAAKVFVHHNLMQKVVLFSQPSDREEKKCSTVGTATFDGDLKAIHVSRPGIGNRENG